MEGIGSHRPPSRTMERSGGEPPMGRRLEPLSTQMPRIGYGMDQTQMHSPYTPQALPTPISYQPEYQHEQARPAGYPSYGASMDYSMPQPQSTPSYGQYPQRQGMEVMPGSYGVQQYYDQTNTPSTMPTPPPPPPPQHAPHYPQVQYGQPPPPDRMQQPYTPQSSVDPTVEHEYHQQQHQQPQVSTMDDAYNQYLHVLRQAYMDIRDSRLALAGDHLLTISNWLLSNAEELGLVRDDKNLHEDRVQLWNEFNMCWITCMRKQKELLQEGVLPNQILPPRSMIQADFLKRMGTELVRLCDSLEKFGLVDYQFGVWEEEILEAIQECLDIVESPVPAHSSPNPSNAQVSSPVKTEPPISTGGYEQSTAPHLPQTWTSSSSETPNLPGRA